METVVMKQETYKMQTGCNQLIKRRPTRIDCKPAAHDPLSKASKDLLGVPSPYLTAVPVHDLFSTEASLGAVSSMQGSYASVRVMKETTSGLKFAAKIGDCDANGSLRWAATEFEILQSLSHQGIVRAVRFLVDAEEKRSYMFMPIEGDCTLTSYVDKHGPFSPCAVKRLARQLFDALSYMHRKKVIHRDVNPNNYLYSSHKATLIDFNTAIRIPVGAHPPLTGVVGTQGYKAPEMRRFEEYDEKVDVWSLGATLAFALGLNADSDFSQFEPEMADFFNRILSSDPALRPTAETAKDHPWLSCV